MTLDCVVKIVNNNGEWIGSGFVVSKHHIMTCAHVVAEVLGNTDNEKNAILVDPDPPAGSIDMIFMKEDGQGVQAKGSVLLCSERDSDAGFPGWSPKQNSLYDKAIDVAVLEVEGGVPPHSKPVSVHKAIPAVGLKVRAYGPDESSIYEAVDAKKLGDWGEGHTTGAVGNGLHGLAKSTELDVKTFIHAGFSGGAIFQKESNQPALVGLVTQANDSENRARMVPASSLLEIYPDLGGISDGVNSEFRAGTDEIWPLYFVDRVAQKANFNQRMRRVLGAAPGKTDESALLCVLEASHEDYPFGFCERLRLDEIGKRSDVQPSEIVFEWGEYEDAEEAIFMFYDRLFECLQTEITSPQHFANALNANNQPVILRMNVASQKYQHCNAPGLRAFIEAFAQVAKLPLNNELYFILTLQVSPTSASECELTKLLHGDLQTWLESVPHCLPKRMGTVVSADVHTWLTYLQKLRPEQEWRNFFEQKFNVLYARVHQTFPEGGELTMSAFIDANRSFRIDT